MIEALSAGDAEALSAVHRSSFKRFWSAAAIRSLLQPENVLAFGDQPLTGFIMVRVAAREAEILTIAVTPSGRRRGLGRRLLRHAEQTLDALGAEVLFLEVAEDNHPARELYHSQGYSLAARRRGYYQTAGGSTVDALVLSKRPSPRLNTE